MSINECSLTGYLASASLHAISIYRLDVRGADLTNIEFDNVNVAALVVDSFSKFGHSTPNVQSIHISEESVIHSIRDPGDVKDWIAHHSIVSDDEESLPLMKFFERVCRRALRQFYFRVGEGDPAAELIKHELWPEVVAILKEHERLEETTKQVSGPSSMLYHVRGPRELLYPASDDLVADTIRRKMRQRAKEIAIV